MLDKIKTNEETLSNLKGRIKQGEKNYFPFMAALNALDINNELLKYVGKTFDGDAKEGEALERLYAVLQSLFVSIDALYTLNIILTKNKNNININQNRQLRELKYIRNDVVGHPSNRVYDGERVGCCVLKKDLVTKKSFKYYIYFNGEIKAREVKIPELINSYYDEANKFLTRAMGFKDYSIDEIVAQLRKIMRKLASDVETKEDIFELRSLYLKSNAATSKNDVRFIWRVELLLKLENVFTENDKELKDIVDYAIGYQLVKLYETLTPYGVNSEKEGLANAKKKPKGILQFEKMVEKNSSIETSSKFLHDMTHPLFVGSLNKCIDYANETGSGSAKKYLEVIKTYYEQKDSDMVYCLGISLKNCMK